MPLGVYQLSLRLSAGRSGFRLPLSTFGRAGVASGTGRLAVYHRHTGSCLVYR